MVTPTHPCSRTRPALPDAGSQPAAGAEENLARRPGVRVSVSVSRSSGGGAADPHVLLNEVAHRLDGRPLAEFDQSNTYDTFDGRNTATGADWYALDFGQPVTFNCIEMTMGLPYRDGGWWISLDVEVRTTSDTAWQCHDTLRIMPPYSFADSRAGRLPYQTYALTFSQVTAVAVRVIGTPGGSAQFTALGRLAVYHRDLSHWNPADLDSPPIPHIFRLISPHIVWDLSEHLVKLTGLIMSIPLMEYYLDAPRYSQFWQRISRNYQGEPELWYLVGDSIGWTAWRHINMADTPDQRASSEPHVRTIFHHTLASAVAPVVIDGQVLGELRTRPVLLGGEFDWPWHQAYAQEHAIPWPAYSAAVERSPHMTRDQLTGAAGLMGMIVNTIANLAHHIDRYHDAPGRRFQQKREIVHRAIDFMEENLEEPIGVVDVARAVSLSPPYFCTVFTEGTGHNPSEFLINLRIERAKEYLAHTQMSVMDVCIALGYDSSYFSRLFKRRTGSTPGQYARLMRSR